MLGGKETEKDKSLLSASREVKFSGRDFPESLETHKGPQAAD